MAAHTLTQRTSLSLAAGLGLLSTLPFVALELVNRRSYGEHFPYAVFAGLWLAGTLFCRLLLPPASQLHDGPADQRARLALRIAVLLLLAAVWAAIVADQMPCFLGMRYCD